MGTRFSVIALACALSLYPQAVHSQQLSEQVPAPIEHRRLTIIVDGAEPGTQPTGGQTPPAAAAPNVSAEALEPLADVARTPAGTPASAFSSAARVDPAPLSAQAPPADWAADALRVPMPAGEGWRIQVGAFSDAARAETYIASLELLAAGPGADPIRLVVPNGANYRAQMSGFADRAAADGACARITASGKACFVVEPQS